MGKANGESGGNIGIPSTKFYIRNNVLLSLCYLINTTVTFAYVNTTAVATSVGLGYEQYALLPLAMWVVCSGVSNPFVGGLLLPRFGYHLMFVTGTSLGCLASLMCATSLSVVGPPERVGESGHPLSLVLMVLGNGMLGVATSMTRYYRHVASSVLTTDEYRSYTIATLVTGGSMAGVLGPMISYFSVDLIEPRPYAGVFFVTACLDFAQTLILIFFFRLPTEAQLRVVDAQQRRRDAEEQRRVAAAAKRTAGESDALLDDGDNHREGKHVQDEETDPLLHSKSVNFDEIPVQIKFWKRPIYWQALIAMASSNVTMVSVMGITPLVITDLAEENETDEMNGLASLDPFLQVSIVVAAHVVAMYAPSIPFGILMKRIGCLPLIYINLVFLAGGLGAFFLGNVVGILVGLLFIGVTWNAVFVSSSTLLGSAYMLEEKYRAQTVHDVLVYSLGGIFSLSVGALYASFGLTPIIIVSEVALSLGLAAILSLDLYKYLHK
mmetsp:Transcript_26636/g.74451  ORF Transcript_26636/g.74451 Transcript_26636/m.74451 type:complete len:495 (+) Transcript_26636:143-1627(+)